MVTLLDMGFLLKTYTFSEPMPTTQWSQDLLEEKTGTTSNVPRVP